jgi:hypothetical protein
MFLDWLERCTCGDGLDDDTNYLRNLLAVGDTIYHEHHTTVLRKVYGFRTEWRTDEKTADVNALLDFGIPVVCNILHRGARERATGGHIIMLVARRKSEGTYIAHDPYGTLGSNYSDTNGKHSLISKRDFAGRWQGGYRILLPKG